MNNKLFIVCPFSFMETVLQGKYGNDIFFITCSGTVLQCDDFEYMCEIKKFIQTEKIKSIYIVNDLSCRFLNAVVAQKKLSGLSSEKAIQELYLEYYFADFKDQPIVDQKRKLAKRNIERQINELLNSLHLGHLIRDLQIELKGLISDKSINSYKEISIKKKYESL